MEEKLYYIAKVKNDYNFPEDEESWTVGLFDSEEKAQQAALGMKVALMWQYGYEQHELVTVITSWKMNENLYEDDIEYAESMMHEEAD